MNQREDNQASLSHSATAFKEVHRQTGPGFVKKRKLSLDGSESESVPSFRQESLQERFSALSIAGNATKPTPLPSFLPTSSAEFTRESPSLKIPKPVKLVQTHSDIKVEEQEDGPQPTPEKGEFLEKLLKISQNDMSGISKYLDLDLDNKLKSWNQTVKPQDKKLSSSIITSFFNSPFSSTLGAFMNPYVFNTAPEMDIEQFSTSIGSMMKSSFSKENGFVGPLTREERLQKINQYLEKKKNRRWKHVRYNVRKDLADKRERVQGRFVKTKKMMFQMEEIKSDSSLPRSDFEVNNLGNSYPELKRSTLSDL